MPTASRSRRGPGACRPGSRVQGVRNRLKVRNLGDDAVTPETTIVSACVVEIGRLQLEEKAVYTKP